MSVASRAFVEFQPIPMHEIWTIILIEFPVQSLTLIEFKVEKLGKEFNVQSLVISSIPQNYELAQKLASREHKKLLITRHSKMAPNLGLKM